MIDPRLGRIYDRLPKMPNGQPYYSLSAIALILDAADQVEDREVAGDGPCPIHPPPLPEHRGLNAKDATEDEEKTGDFPTHTAHVRVDLCRIVMGGVLGDYTSSEIVDRILDRLIEHAGKVGSGWKWEEYRAIIIGVLDDVKAGRV